jgi:hypothetical protein
MQEIGWVEGQNVRSEYRLGGGDLARINAAASELVALTPELIYACGCWRAAPSIEIVRSKNQNTVC